jgi:integrase
LLIGPPKTTAGIRSVAIPPHLLPALRVWADRAPARKRDELLFPAGDGRSPLNDSVLREAHDKGKAAIDMPGLTVHGLRHTSATLEDHHRLHGGRLIRNVRHLEHLLGWSTQRESL